MKFTPYQSLVGESMKGFTHLLTDEDFLNQLCVVTEKIHGANFSVYLSNDGINFASRSQILGADTNFMSCKRYFTEEKISEILELYSSYVKGGQLEFRLIGEIYGGLDIPTIKAVQKEVHYSGDIGFKVFSVEVLGVDGILSVLDWNAMVHVTNSLGLETVPVISICPFKEAYLINPSVNTQLSDKENNECEGFTLRIDCNGCGEQPLIFKRRNINFLENKGKSLFEDKTTAASSENALQVLINVGTLITQQRVSNVNSHFGFNSMTDFNKLMAAVIEDVLKDYNTEFGVDIREDAVWKEVKKLIGNKIIPLVKVELN